MFYQMFLKYPAIIVLVLVLLRCDFFQGVFNDEFPYYEYNYYIQNKSSSDISVLFYSNEEHTFYGYVISATDTLLIHHERGAGVVHDLSNDTNTFIYSLFVYANNTLKYQQTPIDLSKWTHSGVSDGWGTSNYTFIVTDSLLN
jgi:hypothetical protein